MRALLTLIAIIHVWHWRRHIAEDSGEVVQRDDDCLSRSGLAGSTSRRCLACKGLSEHDQPSLRFFVLLRWMIANIIAIAAQSCHRWLGLKGGQRAYQIPRLA